MRRSLRGTTALVTEGSLLHPRVPGKDVMDLTVGGYMGGAFDPVGDAGAARRATGPSEAFKCSDGEIYLKGDNLLARLTRA